MRGTLKQFQAVYKEDASVWPGWAFPMLAPGCGKQGENNRFVLGTILNVADNGDFVAGEGELTKQWTPRRA